MNFSKAMRCCVVAPLGIAAAVAMAEQDSEVVSQIAQLKREIASLKGSESQWLSEERAAEIRSIVGDVLSDADTRSSLQGSSGTSGYNGGFFLSSADGNYSMKINVLEQIRWSFNDSEDGTTTTQANGFENKRTRLTFGGSMVDSSWSYQLAYYLGYSNSVETVGANEVSDAFVMKTFECGASLTVGQFKLPFCAEYQLDVGNLQFADYSTVDAIFCAGYGQGIKLGYESEVVRGSICYVNAPFQANQDWTAASPSSEWALVGRVEGKFAGNWSQFEHAQSWRGDSLGVRAGAGLSWNQANPDPSTDPSTEVAVFTIDTTVNFGGANLAVAYFCSSISDSGSAVVDDASPTGFTIAAGFFVTDDVELVARYETASMDVDLGGAQDFATISAGGNLYLAKNQAKLGVDFGYALDAISPVFSDYAIGNNWVLDTSSDGGQWMIRSQLSFSF